MSNKFIVKLINTNYPGVFKGIFFFGSIYTGEPPYSNIDWESNTHVYWLDGVDEEERMYIDSDSGTYTVIAHFDAYGGKVTYIGYDWADASKLDANESGAFEPFAQV